jgi:hypothetical protein
VQFRPPIEAGWICSQTTKLSAVKGHSLRFKYRETIAVAGQEFERFSGSHLREDRPAPNIENPERGRFLGEGRVGGTAAELVGSVPLFFEIARMSVLIARITRLSGPAVREVTVAPRNPASRAIAFSSDAYRRRSGMPHPFLGRVVDVSSAGLLTTILSDRITSKQNGRTKG